MRYEDASGAFQASGPIANDDSETLAAGSRQAATGNLITGEGTQYGSAGADSAAGGHITSIGGKGGEDSSFAGGKLSVAGEFGHLSVDAQGNYSYLANKGAPENVRDRFTYTLADNQGNTDTAALVVELGKTPVVVKSDAQQILVGPDGVVTLPPGVELSDIMVVGRNLVINMPDGTQMIIVDGAVFVPQLVLGGIEIPASNVAALLIGQEPQPAAGELPPSSGGNFALPPPPLDPGVPLGDLIPPMEDTYIPPEPQEVFDQFDRDPEIFIQPDGQPASVAAVDNVDERGLPARDGNLPDEPEGTGEGADGNPSNDSDTSEATSGTIIINSPDGVDSVTINGILVTGAIGQPIGGLWGTLTITGFDGDNILYSYVLNDNTPGNDTHDDFLVTLTDDDGDVASATLTIDIIDDVPTARDDTDSIPAGEYGPATGNVLTDAAPGDAGDSDTNAADTVGADDADLTAVTGFGATSAIEGGFEVQGQYGVLTIFTDGEYSYVRNQGTPGGVQDVFTYTLTDGDSDTDTATLTISIGDATPETGENPVALLDDDAVPGADGNPGGPEDDVDADNLSGTLEGSGGDGPLTFDLLLTGAPTGFSYENGPNGAVHVMQGTTHVLTITIDAATGAYTVSQINPIDHASLDGLEGDDTENNVEFTIDYTVTDQDDDSASGTLQINVDDDTPVIEASLDREGAVTVDESGPTSGSTIVVGGGVTEGDDLDVAGSGPIGRAVGATAVVSATALYGADGPSGSGLTYTLELGGTDTPLTLTDGSPIELQLIDGVVVGVVTSGSHQGEAAFAIAVNSTSGVATVELYLSLDHPDDSNPNDSLQLGPNTVSVVVSATDGDGDSADSDPIDISGLFNFLDDGPSVDSEGVEPQLIADESDFTTNPTGDFSDLFDEAFGADGAAASDSRTYSLELGEGSTGLVDTLTNEAVVLTIEGGDVYGRTAIGGDIVFIVSVDANGVVTVDQQRSVVHPDPNNHDESKSLASDDLIVLKATVTDGDGDTDEATVSIGNNVVLDDDGPSIDRNLSTVPTLVTDDTDTPGDTAGPVSFAGLFTGDFGADGFKDVDDNDVPDADALQFTLSLKNGNGTNSGLVDVLTGDAILLRVTGSGDIEGYLASDDSIVAFTIDLQAGGNVSLIQDRAITHNDPTDPVESGDSAASMAGDLIVLTATIRDGDLDSDSATANIGNAFKFEDDGPSVSPSQEEPELTVDDSTFATDDTTSFAGAFNFDFGADGFKDADDNNVEDADAIAYTLDISATGAASGLVDTLSGDPILLFMNGNVVEGRVGGAGGAVAFSVSVDSLGNVTLNQSRAVVHDDPNDPSEAGSPATLSADNLITLTATVTDGDNDTDSATINIGQNLNFEDDGPSINRNTVAVPTLVTDDTDTPGDTAGPVSFAGLFNSSFGNDGFKDANDDNVEDADALAFGLSITGGNGTDSLLNDVLTGDDILLRVNGNTIEGYLENAPGTIAFVLTLDPATGEISQLQNRAITHDDPADPVESGSSAATMAAGLIVLTATITDGDGDHASANANIGDAFRFEDDGPSAANDVDSVPGASNGPATGNVLTGTEVAVAEDANGTDGVADNPGKDGGRVSFIDNTLNVAPGVAVPAGGSVAIAGQFGTLTIFANGDYSYARNPGEGGGQSEVFRYTLLDGDGDTVTATLTIEIGDSTPVAGTAFAAVDDDALGGNSSANPNDINANTQPNPDDLDGAGSSEATFRGNLTVTGGDGDIDFSLVAPVGAIAIGQETVNITGNGALLTATIATSPDASRVGDTLFTVSLNQETGEYIVTLVDNVLHVDDANNDEDGVEVSVNIPFQVNDLDGDVSAANGTLNIIFNDDVPTATNDTDAVAAGSNGPATGNVITGTEVAVPEDANGTDGVADTQGADGATVTFIDNTLNVAAGSNVPAGGSVAIAGQFGTLTIFANGDYSYARTPGQGGGQSEVFQYTLTDADGDQSTATLTINIADLTPVAGTANAAVDDDGLPNANAAVGTNDIDANTQPTPDDLDGALSSEATFRGNLTVTGGDGDIDFSLVAPVGAVAVGQETVNITGTGALLTATIATSPDADRVGDTLFTVSLNQETGEYVVTLVDNVLHADDANNDEDGTEVSVNIPFQVVDQDGDASAANGTLNIVFNDDVPAVTDVTDPLEIENTGLTPTGTGDFAFNIGADQNSDNDDIFIDPSTFTISINGEPAENVQFFTDQDAGGDPSPETATEARYRFTFEYDTGAGGNALGEGTLVFDKVLGEYTVTITSGPISGFTIVQTSDLTTTFDEYDLNGGAPDVVVATLGENIFAQFTAVSTANNSSFEHLGTSAGGDTAWNPNELFTANPGNPQVSNTDAGVDGNTMDTGEVLDFNLYAEDPGSDTTPAVPTTYASDMFMQFFQYAGDDLIIILKLARDSNDDGTLDQFTTRAIIVDPADLFYDGDSAADTPYESLVNGLGSQDALLVIESNDYNADGENWVITGAQIVTDEDGTSGSGINLIGGLGDTGASDTNGDGSFTGAETQLFSSDTDVSGVKITSIGFLVQDTTDQSATIEFDVTVEDADGDSVTTPITVNIGETVAPLAPLMAESSLLSSQEEQLQKTAANSNTLTLAAAVGAAGITESAAAKGNPDHSNNGHDQSEPSYTTQQVETFSVADDGGDASVSALAIEPSAEESALADTSSHKGSSDDGSSNSLDDGSQASAETSDAPASDGGNAADQSADAASLVAPAVSIPSAEALEAASNDNGHGQKGGSVEKIVAEALGHGDAPLVDAILDGLPGGNGELAAMAHLASPGAGSVSSWDMGAHGAIGAGFDMMFKMDVAIHHQDAVQPVANG